MNKEEMVKFLRMVWFNYNSYCLGTSEETNKMIEIIGKVRTYEDKLTKANEKLEKIEKWCYQHGQEINATDILDIIKGSDKK